MTRAALAAGFPDSSSYYRRADAALGMTASQFRRGGAATVVTRTTGDCALGRCTWRRASAASARCCRVITMRHCSTTCAGAFPMPSCVKAPRFCQQMAEIFAHLDDSRRPVSLPLDLQGTAFQLQVWQALRQIPVGETRSYRRWQSILASRGQ